MSLKKEILNCLKLFLIIVAIVFLAFLIVFNNRDLLARSIKNDIDSFLKTNNLKEKHNNNVVYVNSNEYKNYIDFTDELRNQIINLEQIYGNDTGFLNKIYPVGSIYITTSYSTNADVSKALGGTWEAFGAGRTLVGVDTANTSFNTVGKTGGSSTTTLAKENLSSHTHSIPALSGTAASAGAHKHKQNSMPNFISNRTTVASSFTIADVLLGSINTVSAGAHTHSVSFNANTSGSAGKGEAFTNLQPYITAYMYKRTK